MDGKLAAAAFGSGLGIAYFCDPDAGKRRRALLRDKLARARAMYMRGMGKLSRDLPQRGQGLLLGARTRLWPDHPDDVVLEQRVRAALGRTVDHPGSIDVRSEDCCVTLSGPILANEASRAISRVRSVPGVRGVINNLAVCESPEGIPGLQGTPAPRKVDRFEFLQEAACFGCDPKREMDDDMARFKTLMETGRYPHDAARPPVRTGLGASTPATHAL